MPNFIPDDVWYSIFEDIAPKDVLSLRKSSSQLYRVGNPFTPKTVVWPRPVHFDGNAECWERARGLRPQTPNIALGPDTSNRIQEVIVGYPEEVVPQMGSGRWNVIRMNSILVTFSNLVSLSIVKTVFPVITLLELITNLTHLETLTLDNVLSPCEDWGLETSDSLYTDEGHLQLPPSLKALTITGEYRFSRWDRSLIPILIILSSSTVESLTLDPFSIHSIFTAISSNIVDPCPIRYGLPIHGRYDMASVIGFTPNLRTLIVHSLNRTEWRDDWHTPFRTSSYAKTLLQGLRDTVITTEVHGYIGGHNGGGNITMSRMTHITGPLHFNVAFLNRGHVIRKLIVNSWVRNYDSFDRLLSTAITSPNVDTFWVPVLYGNARMFMKIAELFPSLRNLHIRIKSCNDYRVSFTHVVLPKQELTTEIRQPDPKKFANDILKRLPLLETFHLDVEDIPSHAQTIDETVKTWGRMAPNLIEVRLDTTTVRRRITNTDKWSTVQWHDRDTFPIW
ncbi:hypothetical protein V5O48_005224 [Marasmius crinis-equi]|uniref:F-box domain-containing protein n=1 Tax=Marasmius crinis-equi TaxID=585013 RepID=A0ABR3FMX4_9AGAR